MCFQESILISLEFIGNSIVWMYDIGEFPLLLLISNTGLFLCSCSCVDSKEFLLIFTGKAEKDLK